MSQCKFCLGCRISRQPVFGGLVEAELHREGFHFQMDFYSVQ